MTTTVNINSSLKINVTPIESGASGGVLFQKSDGKLGQSSNLHWDNVNSRLSIGQGNTPGARLDVRAQGVLSTDIAFRVRNSAGDRDIISIQGNEATKFNVGYYASFEIGLTGNNAPEFTLRTSGRITSRLSSDYDITDNYTGSLQLYNYSSVLQTTIKAVGNSYFAHATSNIILGGTSAGTSAQRNFVVYNGTAPSTSPADGFSMYSADIVAGNAAPHFRTEKGSIIKLFQGAALTVSDGTLTNAVTRIAELEARLQAHGLIA